MTSQILAIKEQIAAQLADSKFLNPTAEWLSAFMSTQKPTTPVPALVQTALFRLLASDITTSLRAEAMTCFPPDVSNPGIKELILPGAVVAQLLNIEDMSKSRWEQVEAIEALERGEGSKGREIIRVTATEDSDDSQSNIAKGGGPHKLLLQDARGKSVYAIELKDIKGVAIGMSIGCKFVLKNARIARGVALLEPASTAMLGGKIEELHNAWKENRKTQLLTAIQESEQVVRAEA